MPTVKGMRKEVEGPAMIKRVGTGEPVLAKYGLTRSRRYERREVTSGFRINEGYSVIFDVEMQVELDDYAP